MSENVGGGRAGAARDAAPAAGPVTPRRLRVAGMTRLSSVDWPEHLVATVFLQGCPWDCFYCHNPALIDPRAPGRIAWSEVVSFLERRRGMLDGVVFSGGEPTLHAALEDAVDEVRALGFGVGLHTSGAYPRRLERLLPRLDWVGLDIKATDAGYDHVVGRGGGADRAWRALELVLHEHARRAGSRHPLDYEVRTTVHSDAIDEAGLCTLADRLAGAGVGTWALQRFRTTGTRDGMPRVDGPSRSVDLGVVDPERFERVIIR
ncbi:anaerobic ribonucleoside-triphosphate reductase activating protein [Microbacterium sp. KR10-403]|uniref:anaerobic ribonucleoside-triphosphate reductase activating protein n=1 Tax=Microbacterium sp. KR10-403 TaxID=3158581 RepID=UPI0032E52C1E